MTETFVALLLAHMLGDFTLQTGWIAGGKAARRPGPVAAHGAIHLAAAAALLGTWHPALALLVAVHLGIDLAKSVAPADRLWPFLADQAAHLASLGAVAFLWPDLWADGYWAGGFGGGGFWAGATAVDWLPGAMALAAGLIAATQMGGYAIGLLIAPFGRVGQDEGLPNAGQLIGLLERGLIFLLVMVGQPAGIAFLIAAKSVLRYETSTESRKVSEYIIIGTLASFGWAMAMSWGCVALLGLLPGIGIPLSGP